MFIFIRASRSLLRQVYVYWIFGALACIKARFSRKTRIISENVIFHIALLCRRELRFACFLDVSKFASILCFLRVLANRRSRLHNSAIWDDAVGTFSDFVRFATLLFYYGFCKVRGSVKSTKNTIITDPIFQIGALASIITRSGSSRGAFLEPFWTRFVCAKP